MQPQHSDLVTPKTESDTNLPTRQIFRIEDTLP